MNGIGEALDYFAKREYDKTLQVIEELLKRFPNSFTLRHNLAIVLYFQCNQRNPEKILQELKALENDITLSLDSSQNSTSSLPKISPSNKELITYNQAVLHYKYKRYDRVEKLLKQLASPQSLDQLEEYLALKVSLLLLESYYQQLPTGPAGSSYSFPEKVQSIIQHLESSFRTLLVESKVVTKSKTSSSSSLISSPIQIKQKIEQQQQKLKKPTSDSNMNLEMSNKVVQNEKEYIEVEKNLLINHLGVFESKCCLHFHKSRYLILLKKYDNAEKEVNHAITAACNHSNYQIGLGALIVLKAHLKVLQAKYDEGIDLLQQVQSDIPLDVFYNNVGFIFAKMKKQNLALLYFRKALKELQKIKKSKEESPQGEKHSGSAYLASASRDTSAQIYYNIGLNLLMNKNDPQPEEAFKFFSYSIHQFHNNPKLWMRIAECCIVVHDNKVNQFMKAQKPTIFVDRLGKVPQYITFPTFKRTNIGLPLKIKNQIPISVSTAPTLGKDNDLKLLNPSEHDLDPEFSDLSLDLAEKCLQNAISLLGNSLLQLQRKRQQQSKEETIEQKSHLYEKKLLNLIRIANLKLSYVSLSLENALMAFNYAKKVIEDSEGDPNTRIIALCYAVEALCIMDKTLDAQKLLTSVKVQELLQHSLKEGAKGNQHSLKEALLINMSIMHIMQHQYSKAEELIKECNSQSREVFLLSIYLLLVTERYQEVHSFVSNHPISCNVKVI